MGGRGEGVATGSRLSAIDRGETRWTMLRARLRARVVVGIHHGRGCDSRHDPRLGTSLRILNTEWRGSLQGGVGRSTAPIAHRQETARSRMKGESYISPSFSLFSSSSSSFFYPLAFAPTVFCSFLLFFCSSFFSLFGLHQREIRDRGNLAWVGRRWTQVSRLDATIDRPEPTTRTSKSQGFRDPKVRE